MRSQRGPLVSATLTALPTCRATRIESQPFRVWLCRRLRLPVPLTSRNCRCGRRLDKLGHHRAACSRAGVLESEGSRSFSQHLTSLCEVTCTQLTARQNLLSQTTSWEEGASSPTPPATLNTSKESAKARAAARTGGCSTTGGTRPPRVSPLLASVLLCRLDARRKPRVVSIASWAPPNSDNPSATTSRRRPSRWLNARDPNLARTRSWTRAHLPHGICWRWRSRRQTRPAPSTPATALCSMRSAANLDVAEMDLPCPLVLEGGLRRSDPTKWAIRNRPPQETWHRPGAAGSLGQFQPT